MVDFVSTLCESNVPILLLDTCSILDLLRAPLADINKSKEIRPARTITHGENRIHLIVQLYLHQELNKKLMQIKRT